MLKTLELRMDSSVVGGFTNWVAQTVNKKKADNTLQSPILFTRRRFRAK